MYYEPNSLGGPAQDESFCEPPLKISGDADRYSHRKGNDDYVQPRASFEMFDDEQKQRFFDTIAGAMQDVPPEIIARQMEHFRQVHPDYAQGITDALANS